MSLVTAAKTTTHGLKEPMTKFISGKIALLLRMGSIGVSAGKDQSLQSPQLASKCVKVRDRFPPNAGEASIRTTPWRTSVSPG